MIRRNLEGIDALAQVRQTNGFLEALNGPFPSATRTRLHAAVHPPHRDRPDRRPRNGDWGAWDRV